MRTKEIALIILAVAATTAIARGGGDPSTNQVRIETTKNGIVTNGAALKEPLKSVLDHYIKIQKALADDSTNGISTNAVAISVAVKADKTKSLPSVLADDADDLADAGNAAAARETFKDLSEILIKNLSDENIQTGKFKEAFCPMANAYWLQTNTEIANPYLGNSMPGCGEIKRSFTP